MTSTALPVPTYALYGDSTEQPLSDFFHAETIEVRSRRYDWEISAHLHANFSQILFVAEGGVRLFLQDAERQETGPLLVFAPSGIVHGFRFSPDVVGFVVTVAQDFVDGLPRQDALRIQLQKPVVHRPSDDLTRRLLVLGQELVDAERERFDPHVNRLHHVLAEAWLRTATQPDRDEDSGHNAIAQRFQALVETSYREHRPLTFYADRLHCTIRTLSRQTDMTFGMTPLQLINQRLVFEARRLLRFTNASCSEVAAELGFEDPSYFSRFYRRMTGHAPSVEKERG